MTGRGFAIVGRAFGGVLINAATVVCCAFVVG
jgi:hypothetical protein